MNFHKEIDRVQTPPPPYEVIESLTDNNTPEMPALTPCRQEIGTLPDTSRVADHYAGTCSTNTSTNTKEQTALASPEHDSSEFPHRQEGKRERTRKTPMTLVQDAKQSYKDKRRAKEAVRKVDFYEKLYGFVPKNAMTEAEWRDARERAPKAKVPFKGKSSGGLSIAGLGGIAGGF